MTLPSATDTFYPSMWHETAIKPQTQGMTLAQNIDVDVAIVGGGYTGLWTAYYLKKAAPQLSIAILEAEQVGDGASGRNGGWISSIFPASFRKVANSSSRDAAIRMQHAMNDTLREIGTVINQEEIDCDYKLGGNISLARNSAQLIRAKEEISTWRSWGFDDEQASFLNKDEARERVGASDILGGTFTQHCAVIHPLKLAQGLGELVRSLGVKIYEKTRVTEISPHQLQTCAGRVLAQHIVLGTEAFTCLLPGRKRVMVPMQSLMIATEPLGKNQLAEIGLRERETFSDKRHARIYGQVTADGRIAFGGRGAPYNFGSKIKDTPTANVRVYEMLEKSLRDFFPTLEGSAITHRWSGVFGIPRDWYPGLQHDKTTGVTSTSGYVGNGVISTNLAGRTITDIILDQQTGLTSLPWVNKKNPKWEIEPLRWLAVNAVSQLFAYADKREAVTNNPSILAKRFWYAIGN